MLAETDLPLLLIVDDDPDQLFFIKLAALKAGGFGVLTAENVRQALDQLRSRAAKGLPPPDLILSDLRMPGMDGIDLARSLKRQPEYRHVPVLLLTSSDYARDREAALDAGIEEVIQKPMHFDDLVKIMQSLPSHLHAGVRT